MKQIIYTLLALFLCTPSIIFSGTGKETLEETLNKINAEIATLKQLQNVFITIKQQPNDFKDTYLKLLPHDVLNIQLKIVTMQLKQLENEKIMIQEIGIGHINMKTFSVVMT